MRIARKNTAGVIYHVISRFLDRSWRLVDDHERAYYLHRLGLALAKSDWLCFAFALMSSHIHLGFVAGRRALGGWAKSANGRFARWLNDRRDGLGPVFADRPADFAIPRARLADLVAYIHNNPVRAGVAATAGDSTWTSHNIYLGRAPRPAWLCVDDTLAAMGMDRTQFDAWVNQSAVTMRGPRLEALRRELRPRGELTLATPTVGDSIAVPVVARPFATVRPDPRLLVRVVAELVHVPEADNRRTTLAGSKLLARRLAVHAARRIGLCGSDVAALLGLSRQGVSRIAHLSLSSRELELCDAAVDRLCIELT
jgi:hypothetical protein